LLAIILPASTYVDQVMEADQRNIRDHWDVIDRQYDWDISVRALAHYPSLLRKMADNPDWTAALGQAYVEQPYDVMDAIQLLRRQARYNGVLRSNREQRVYLQGDYVRIVPARSNMIYVPQYDPNVVYVRQRSNNNNLLLAFGVGLLIGAWLSNDTDWDHHRIYNHGWTGSGWIADSRPNVTINNIYMVNRDQPVTVNRTIVSRQVNRTRVRNYSLPATFAPVQQTHTKVTAYRTTKTTADRTTKSTASKTPKSTAHRTTKSTADRTPKATAGKDTKQHTKSTSTSTSKSKSKSKKDNTDTKDTGKQKGKG
jgi:hypothetical protein